MGNISFSKAQSLSIIRRLDQTNKELSTTYERLSSGQRINQPSDDAASLAISTALKNDARVYTQAIRNTNDAISILSVADGALEQLQGITTRLTELAEQAANGGYSLTQRKALDKEAAELVKEFNRIVDSTTFNNNSLLEAGQDPTRIQMGYGLDGSIAFTLAEMLQRNQGTGTFGAANNVASNTESAVLSADFNGDGFDDLVTDGSGAGTGYVQLSNGDGTFSSVSLSFTGGGTITGVGDYDGNGTQDVVFTSGGNANFFSGNGDGTFQATQTSSLGGPTPGQGKSVDFDGDGKLDLVLRQSGVLYLAKGNGDGTFNSAQSIVTSVGVISDYAFGDFNGDGRVDIAHSNNTNNTGQIYTQNGSGGLTAGGTFDVGAVQGRISAGDINNDGLDDILSSTSGLAPRYYLSNGDGTVQTETSLSTTSRFASFSDLNGDGNLDIVGTDSGVLLTWLGNGSGTFGSAQTNTNALGAAPTANGDFNGDGALDIALSGTGDLDVYLSNTSKASTIGRLYLLNQSSAADALDTLEEIRNRVSKERGQIGSNLSRLQSGLSSLQSTTDNYKSAESRISDTDVSQETARLISKQILQESNTAILAQSKLSSEIVLRLLGGLDSLQIG